MWSQVEFADDLFSADYVAECIGIRLFYGTDDTILLGAGND